MLKYRQNTRRYTGTGGAGELGMPVANTVQYRGTVRQYSTVQYEYKNTRSTSPRLSGRCSKHRGSQSLLPFNAQCCIACQCTFDPSNLGLGRRWQLIQGLALAAVGSGEEGRCTRLDASLAKILGLKSTCYHGDLMVVRICCTEAACSQLM